MQHQNKKRQTSAPGEMIQPRTSPTPNRKTTVRKRGGTRRTGMTINEDEDAGITMATVDNDEQAEFKRPKKPYEIVMEKFVVALSAKKLEGLKAEFKELQAFQPADVTTIAFAGNKDKNRYNNVPCYDKTRVVLTYGVPPATDYIHANWVDTSLAKLGNKFICAQGPLDCTANSPGTISDFWRMVWQEKVRFIVMLCNVIEAGKVKCAQYYPLAVGETVTYGNLSVKNLKNVTGPNEKIYESFLLEVSVEGQSERMAENSLQITLMKWKEWPDFNVPLSALGMMRILKTIRDVPNTTAVIHCSAGIGRTGTLMACEICLRILLEGKELNVLDVMREMRSKRAGAIQTESQYIYLHRAIGEYIQAKKLMKDDLSKFFAAYVEYVKSLGKPQATVDVSNNPAPVPQMSQPPASLPGNPAPQMSQPPPAQLRPK